MEKNATLLSTGNEKVYGSRCVMRVSVVFPLVSTCTHGSFYILYTYIIYEYTIRSIEMLCFTAVLWHAFMICNTHRAIRDSTGEENEQGCVEK